MSQGKVALVDDEDYEWLNQWKWFANNPYKNLWYAVRNITLPDKSRTLIKMHRLILELTDYSIKGDHIDGNGLNNQRDNLRPATHSQNIANKHNYKNKYLGVSLRSGQKSYQAYVCKDGVLLTKTFKSERDAVIWYNWAALTIHGEFARLNPELPIK